MTAWYLFFAFLLVVANGFFVAAEFALVKVRPTQLAEAAAKGSSRARMARHLARHLDAYLSACQLGVTLASLALGWIGESAFAGLLVPIFEKFTPNSTAWACERRLRRVSSASTGRIWLGWACCPYSICRVKTGNPCASRGRNHSR